MNLYDEIDWEARQDLWDKYYKPDTDDWGRPTSESPMRGYTVCQRCSNLVEETWKHLDWHEKLEPGEDWKR